MGITVPNKFLAIWASDESNAFVTQPIPATPQTGGRASLPDGFPPICFVNPSAGGVPQDGRDVNGLGYMLTAAAQFAQAGGVYKWDSAFSAAIGGYPLGAVVAHATIVGFFWINTTANNTTNPDASGAGWSGFQIANQPATSAQLQFSSTTLLTLVPKGGGWLWINGFNYQVPSSNPTISNGGLSVNTLYYVYAAISGGNMVLSLSTTGYTVGTNGIAVLSGDATKTLVGFLATDSSALFFATGTRSYWNRTPARTRTALASNKTTTSATFVELDSTTRASVLVWAGEQVRFSMNGSFSNGGGGGTASSGVGFDGTTAEPEASAVTSPGSTVIFCSVGINGVKTGLAEGSHYATMLGAVGAGTGTWLGTGLTPATLDVTVG